MKKVVKIGSYLFLQIMGISNKALTNPISLMEIVVFYSLLPGIMLEAFFAVFRQLRGTKVSSESLVHRSGKPERRAVGVLSTQRNGFLCWCAPDQSELTLKMRFSISPFSLWEKWS
jgi:hypothetical protein